MTPNINSVFIILSFSSSLSFCLPRVEWSTFCVVFCDAFKEILFAWMKMNGNSSEHTPTVQPKGILTNRNVELFFSLLFLFFFLSRFASHFFRPPSYRRASESSFLKIWLIYSTQTLPHDPGIQHNGFTGWSEFKNLKWIFQSSKAKGNELCWSNGIGKV